MKDGDVSLLHYIQFKKNHEEALRDMQKLENLTVLDNEWYWGEARTGKSTMAREKYGHSLFSKCINKWFDGYNGEETILLDDFGKTHAAELGPEIKRWADRFVFTGETKGGHMQLRPKRIVITSNYHPHDLWDDEEGMRKPLRERFQIKEFKKMNII